MKLLGLPTTGVKAELAQRLEEAISGASGQAAPASEPSAATTAGLPASEPAAKVTTVLLRDCWKEKEVLKRGSEMLASFLNSCCAQYVDSVMSPFGV